MEYSARPFNATIKEQVPVKMKDTSKYLQNAAMSIDEKEYLLYSWKMWSWRLSCLHWEKHMNQNSFLQLEHYMPCQVNWYVFLQEYELMAAFCAPSFH